MIIDGWHYIYVNDIFMMLPLWWEDFKTIFSIKQVTNAIFSMSENCNKRFLW